jgi:DNA-binding YbaB/EbfC family protein
MKLGNLMKQAQQMQEGLAKAQEEVKHILVTGEAGAGLVQVQMSGVMEVQRVTIDPDVFNEDKEVLEDLLAAAVNDAVRKAQSAAHDKMAGLTAGMSLPEGFKMPF